MTAAVPAKCPTGVEHLFGTMYRIRLSMIQVADGGFDPDATTLEFRNPRWTTIDGKSVGRGFTQEEMEDLREDIRQVGLNHPLRCRWFPYEHPRAHTPKSVQLVDGERRCRSLLWLCQENPDCWDAQSKLWVPARQLYEFVECRVTEMSDEEALHLAVKGNETSVQIGTGAQVGLVKHLRQVGKTDDEILVILGRGTDWLLKTEKLFTLPAPIFKALCEDRINRKVAKALGEVKDDKIREAKFELALQATDARIARLEREFLQAEEEVELQQAVKEVAAETGDTQEAAAADSRIEKLKKKVKRARQAMSRPRTSITSGKDLEASGSASKKSFTPAKIEKVLYAPCCLLLKQKGIDPDTKEPMELDLDDARLIKAFCELLKEGTTGDSDTLMRRFLEAHKRAKAKRNK